MESVDVYATCGTEFTDGHTCKWEDVVEVYKEDWKEGLASARCPECDLVLEQKYGHFEFFTEEQG